jgi:alkylhydroperoxidase family enzyme
MRLVAWIADRFGWARGTPSPGEHAVEGYLALGRRLGSGATLEPRTVLLAGVLAAELGGCRWCIEQTRHHWRIAGFPLHLLHQLRPDAGSRFFTGRERAALAFVTAIACERPSRGDIDRARQILTDNELAELTAIVAEHHCLEHLDPNLPEL